MNCLNLSEIQRNSEQLDSEALHIHLLEQVESGEYDTFLEAMTAYVEENDISLEPSTIKKYISPSLMGILQKEASDKSLLKDRSNHSDISTFF